MNLKKLWLAAVAGAVVLLPGGPASAQQCTTPFDPSCHNLKCYKIGGPALVQPLQLDDQFGRERIFKLVPQFLCNPTLKSCCVKKPDGTFDCSNPSPGNCPPDPSQQSGPVPVDHFKCYKIQVKECPPCTPSPTNPTCVQTATGAFDCTMLIGKFPPIPPPIQVQLLDQFHEENVRVGPPQLLCVPVVKKVISPTTTTTPVTTTTTTTRGCGGTFPNCGGACPGQDLCHPPPGVSTCECCTPSGVPCSAVSVCCSGQACGTSGTCP